MRLGSIGLPIVGDRIMITRNPVPTVIVALGQLSAVSCLNHRSLTPDASN